MFDPYPLPRVAPQALSVPGPARPMVPRATAATEAAALRA